jgi:acetylxylan esterase
MSVLQIAFFFLSGALASPVKRELPVRDDCPEIHVFGARETLGPPGLGLAGYVVEMILDAHSGATSEAINYPAIGVAGDKQDLAYSLSADSGVGAVASQVTWFVDKCPDTKIVIVGYSQARFSAPRKLSLC